MPGGKAHQAEDCQEVPRPGGGHQGHARAEETVGAGGCIPAGKGMVMILPSAPQSAG